MDDASIRSRFQSMVYVLLHFSCSLIALSCTLSILALQITLTVTETCAYRIGVGFWSFPFLLSAPISIWLLLWQRDRFYSYVAIICHTMSMLFATCVILISFIVLVGQQGSSCSTSSISTNYFLSMNISLIAVSILFKVSMAVELILLHCLRNHRNEPSILSEQQFRENNCRILTKSELKSSLKSIHMKYPGRANDLDVWIQRNEMNSNRTQRTSSTCTFHSSPSYFMVRVVARQRDDDRHNTIWVFRWLTVLRLRSIGLAKPLTYRHWIEQVTQKSKKSSCVCVRSTRQ